MMHMLDHRMKLLAHVAIVGMTMFVMSHCANAGSGRIVDINAMGQVVGFVYFDDNGSRQFDQTDVPLQSVRVALVVVGTTDTIATAVSDATGQFLMNDVLVGSYEVTVDAATIGDTVIVVPQAGPSNVAPNDTLFLELAVSFPVLTIDDALASPVGTRLFVDGVAITTPGVFADSTIHVAGAMGTLRGIRLGLAAAYAIGDSVRLRGTIAMRNGQPVVDLNRRVPVILGVGEIPSPDTLTTAAAATAGIGNLDAALVRVDSARVTDTTTTSEGFSVTVNDGSGAVTIVFDADVVFNLGPFLIPGVDVRVNGVLVSNGTVWRIKPRSVSDVTVQPTILSIAAARAAAPGQRVFVDGRVITSMSASTRVTVFGDSTVHIVGSTGAIRATRVTPITIQPGDSVRVVGEVSSQDGQPVIDAATIFLLGPSLALTPNVVTTAEAASANGGQLDAALVQVDSARIISVQSGPETVVTASDGSGLFEVVLDKDVSFNPGPFLLPGADIFARGVLVPSGGSWRLKPRSDADFKVSVPVISVGASRGMSVGSIVFVDGTALNSLNPFTGLTPFQDTTIHVADPTGAIRATRVMAPGVDITPGDSIRLVGRIALRDGQPVIDSTRLFRLADRPTLPQSAALVLSTANVTSGNGGASDAGFVRVLSATIVSTATIGSDRHLTVDDGSGQAVFVLDGDVAFNMTPLVGGATIDVTGLLVTAGAGTWVLKPRSQSDITVQ